MGLFSFFRSVESELAPEIKAIEAEVAKLKNLGPVAKLFTQLVAELEAKPVPNLTGAASTFQAILTMLEGAVSAAPPLSQSVIAAAAKTAPAAGK